MRCVPLMLLSFAYFAVSPTMAGVDEQGRSVRKEEEQRSDMDWADEEVQEDKEPSKISSKTIIGTPRRGPPDAMPRQLQYGPPSRNYGSTNTGSVTVGGSSAFPRRRRSRRRASYSSANTGSVTVGSANTGSANTGSVDTVGGSSSCEVGEEHTGEFNACRGACTREGNATCAVIEAEFTSCGSACSPAAKAWGRCRVGCQLGTTCCPTPPAEQTGTVDGAMAPTAFTVSNLLAVFLAMLV